MLSKEGSVGRILSAGVFHVSGAAAQLPHNLIAGAGFRGRRFCFTLGWPPSTATLEL